MSGIEIYIDESGDFGPFSEHCPYYVVTMVFHEQVERLYDRMKELEYRLQVLGLENHCIHSSPAIRGEDEYFGMDLAIRRKVIANLMAFVSHGSFKYKCFFARKTEPRICARRKVGELQAVSVGCGGTRRKSREIRPPQQLRFLLYYQTQWRHHP